MVPCVCVIKNITSSSIGMEKGRRTEKNTFAYLEAHVTIERHNRLKCIHQEEDALH